MAIKYLTAIENNIKFCESLIEAKLWGVLVAR